jgi:ATP adenylyltransferase
MQYVGGGATSGCIFCDKAAEQRDAENLIVHRGAHAFILLNLYPYNSGHLMIAPFAHTADLGGLAPEIGADLLSLTQRSVEALSREYRPDGYNLGMNLGRVAGAGVPDHLHVHVVPRWNGDTNFMPLTADTKVMPETVDQTYRRLRPYFQRDG